MKIYELDIARNYLTFIKARFWANQDYDTNYLLLTFLAIDASEKKGMVS